MEKKLTKQQLSVFCHNMAMLMGNGSSSEEALDELALSKQQDEQLRLLCLTLSQSINEDASLSQAVQDSKAFPDYMEKVLQLSSLSGRYEESLMELSDYYGKEDEIEKAIGETVIRPLIFFAILAVIMVVMIFEILPIFTSVYVKLGGYSSGYITMAYVISYVVLIAVIGLLAVAGYCYLGRNSVTVQNMLKKWATDSRLTGKATLTLARYQFMSLFNIMMAGGSVESMAISKIAPYITHPTLKKEVEQLIVNMDEGDSIAAAFQKQEVLPDIYSHMILVGYRNGEMENTIKRISGQMAEDTVKEINNVVLALEPIITISFALSIGLSLISVMLPLISVISNVG